MWRSKICRFNQKSVFNLSIFIILSSIGTDTYGQHKLQSLKGVIAKLEENSKSLSTRITDLSSLEKKLVRKFEEHDAKTQATIAQIETSRKDIVSLLSCDYPRMDFYQQSQDLCSDLKKRTQRPHNRHSLFVFNVKGS